MKFYRLIGVALAAAIVFTGRPLAGRSEQAAATPSGASALDALHSPLQRAEFVQQRLQQRLLI